MDAIEISPARGRRLVKFRNCFCGKQAEKFMDGMFLCLRHWEADKARLIQDPRVTQENIRRCNARCEKERYQRLKEAGLCVTCGKRPNYFGCIRCEICQEKRRTINYASRLKPYEIHPWKQANKMLFAKKKSYAKA